MGSLTLPKLPIIDFSKEMPKPAKNSWVSMCNDVRHALEEYGCFVAVYDDVSLDLHNTIFSEMEGLFDVSTEVKKQNICDKPYHGYVGQYSIIPLHEGLGIDDVMNIENAKNFTDLMWPAGNDRFCGSAHLLAKLVAELDIVVIRMVFESYGAGKYYDAHVGSTNYLLKFFKYRLPQINETNMGFRPHTDKSFTSIIHQNHVNGLEIETRDGEWIAHEGTPSSFVFMAGDALMAWSNGRIHSANHRVIMSGNEERYSLGLFSFSRGIIETPQEVVDEQHPLQFKAFDHTGLLHFFNTDEGRKAKCCARAYCGVSDPSVLV